MIGLVHVSHLPYFPTPSFLSVIMATIISSQPPSSPPSSSLSSIGASSQRLARLIVEDYANENPPDRTSKILFAFLDHSPPDSIQVIAEDIIDYPDLHALADHYFSVI